MGPVPPPPEEPETIQRVRPDLSLASPQFELMVVEGPDQGARFLIDRSSESRTLLGQSTTCAIRLKDRLVSRRHAALDVVGTQLRITDLQSSNGTQVNDVTIADAYLSGGEQIVVGETKLKVERRAMVQVPELPKISGFGRVVGSSMEIRRLYPLFERLSASTVPVIIEGETGTGKEVLAEALHEQGPLAAASFVVFDCTAVPPTLVESELFGHEKGAFTGAVAQRKGVFEQAHGGTLLIDEIGELSIDLQPKLLRVLERSEVRRIGSARPIPVKVRVIAATRRDLDHEVQAGRFRDDLFHRLAVARVELPPLRARRGDVRTLVEHFCRQLQYSPAHIPEELLARWQDAPWPGNIRELRNAVARYVSLGDAAETPRSVSLPPSSTNVLEEIVAEGLPYSQAREQVLEAFRALYVERALAKHGGNVVRAAAASGLARRYFQLLNARRK